MKIRTVIAVTASVKTRMLDSPDVAGTSITVRP
jgi:uncharacterized MnhB-related membrane protein